MKVLCNLKMVDCHFLARVIFLLFILFCNNKWCNLVCFMNQDRILSILLESFIFSDFYNSHIIRIFMNISQTLEGVLLSFSRSNSY